MKPTVIVPTPELIGRAEELRRLAHVSGTPRATDWPALNDPLQQSGSLAAPVLPPPSAPYPPAFVPPKL